MAGLENLVSEAIVQRLGWTLLHFVWQGAAAAAVLAAGLWVLRRRWAGARYVASCAALFLMAVLPMLTFFRLRAAEGARSEARVSRVALPAGFQQFPRPAANSPVPRLANSEAPRLRGERTASRSRTSGAPIQAAPVRPRLAWLAAKLESLLPWFVAAWATGVLILSLRLFGGWVQVQRLRGPPASGRRGTCCCKP